MKYSKKLGIIILSVIEQYDQESIQEHILYRLVEQHSGDDDELKDLDIHYHLKKLNEETLVSFSEVHTLQGSAIASPISITMAGHLYLDENRHEII